MNPRVRASLLSLALGLGAFAGFAVPGSGCVYADQCIQINFPGDDYCNVFEDALMWPPGQPELAEPVPPSVGYPGPLGCVCLNAEETSTLESGVPEEYAAELAQRVREATQNACASAVPDGYDHNCMSEAPGEAPILLADMPFYVGAGDCIGDCTQINPPKGGSCDDPNPYECQGTTSTDDGDDEASSDTGSDSDSEESETGSEETGVYGAASAADYVSCAGAVCEVDRGYAQFVLESLAWYDDGGTTFVYEPARGRYVIHGVTEGSIAHALGILDGDVLDSVDGVPIDGLDAALAALVAHYDAEAVSLTLGRGGQRRTFSCVLVD
ncbi:PDZ domain-containing protein [Plesiocystis pacifica]|uniref:PDZ domain-containing protein n=1 Tax=Plesiocystis pacifica TaxID=191768 RepID=UPI0012FBF879|nr:PDZ domain-containing protein [Plesiocystis pacifica]